MDEYGQVERITTCWMQFRPAKEGLKLYRGSARSREVIMMDSGQSGRRLVHAWCRVYEAKFTQGSLYPAFAFLRSSTECLGNLQTLGNSRYSVRGLFQ